MRGGRLGRARRDLATALGREPSDAEVAAEMELAVEAVADLDAISRTPASLDALVGDSGATTLGDLVDAADASPEDLVVARASQQQLVALIGDLPERESTVIRARYGLEQGRRQTYDEIGARLGVSRERVRQVERDALERLRRAVTEAAS